TARKEGVTESVILLLCTTTRCRFCGTDHRTPIVGNSRALSTFRAGLEGYSRCDCTRRRCRPPVTVCDQRQFHFCDSCSNNTGRCFRKQGSTTDSRLVACESCAGWHGGRRLSRFVPSNKWGRRFDDEFA